MRNFENTIIRQQISSRGGGIEIDCTDFGFAGVRMTAYQNYLGGGMLGAVCGDCNASDWKEHEELVELNRELREYFHNLTNPDTEWESSSFEDNKKRAVSAY